MKKHLIRTTMWSIFAVLLVISTTVIVSNLFGAAPRLTGEQAEVQKTDWAQSGIRDQGKNSRPKGLRLMGGPRQNRLPSKDGSEFPETLTGTQGWTDRVIARKQIGP